MVNKQLDAAFDIVLEEVEISIEAPNQEGAKSFSAGNYDKARQLGEQGEKMSTFRGISSSHIKIRQPINQQ
ncbi:MAG: hypothetical protein PVG14_16835 [Anaerolineales bacterium]|jgi:hypothetical protein